jgi:hypothetical protein
MGEEDPEDARVNSPNSLRAVYGIDRINNAFGCAILPTAVDILFASSPVRSLGELPELNDNDHSAIRSVNTAFLAALRENAEPEADAALYTTVYDAVYADLVRYSSNRVSYSRSSSVVMRSHTVKDRFSRSFKSFLCGA